MFRKIFKTVKDKLFNTSKKENPGKPVSQIFEIKDKPAVVPSSYSHYHGTFANNPPGTTHKPPTMTGSVDNGMTQMKDGRMDYQLRHKRTDRHQMTGRYYHKPWPFKKAVAHVA